MLGNFTYCNPTKLYFGKESIKGLNKELPKYGKNVLLVYGGGSIKKSGIYDEIVKILKENGKEVFENIEDKSLSADGLFKVIFDNLVEGMPCDRVNLVEEESGEKVVWITTTCVHKRFWDAVGGDVNNYYILKDGWIEGFVSSSPKNFVYEREDNKNYIKKA